MKKPSWSSVEKEWKEYPKSYTSFGRVKSKDEDFLKNFVKGEPRREPEIVEIT